tara:strand:+ start:113250 stop:114989 length:1740 start_codon:yes stop_codon:yes gene_type:complete
MHLARNQRTRVVGGLLAAFVLNALGCSSETASEQKNPTTSAAVNAELDNDAATGSPAANDRVPGSHRLADNFTSSPSDPRGLPGGPNGAINRPSPSDSASINAPIPGPPIPAIGDSGNLGGIANPGAENPSSMNPAAGAEPRPLRPDLSPEQLATFLAGADEDMQRIYSGAAGIRDNEIALTRMRQIGKLKLEASKRLRDHADADDEQRVEGARGILQSLSHLAALGDLDSAEELEQLAKENLSSGDPRLVTDSRLVLIGFAIESLQHGKEDAPANIIELVEGLKTSPTDVGVPTLMVLGQARQMLSQYDHHEQAGKVREAIIDLFANAKDEEIARMAAQLAGSVQYDAIDRILDTVIQGGEVSLSQWKEAAETLIDESADIMTVQYLAGAALEFEASGRDDLANATYELLDDRFGEQSDSIGEEARIAIAAHRARKDIIGTPFNFDLPGTDGSPLDVSQFRGQVVLMPFWATGFPQSLQILPQLTALRDAHPNDVTIVGMNLDPVDAPTEEFIEQNRLDFQSYQSVSSPTARVANEMATKFGMVSMPFVVVLDQQGRVVALDFKGQKLPKIVQSLLSP